jgi:hypothetical protein
MRQVKPGDVCVLVNVLICRRYGGLSIDERFSDRMSVLGKEVTVVSLKANRCECCWVIEGDIVQNSPRGVTTRIENLLPIPPLSESITQEQDEGVAA